MQNEIPKSLVDGIDHIDIAVEDVDASAAFFVAMGCALVSRTEHDGTTVQIRFPGNADLILELTPTRRASGKVHPPGLRHIALRCQDINAVYEYRSQSGVAFDAPPKKINGRLLLNARDPGGNTTVQVVQ